MVYRALINLVLIITILCVCGTAAAQNDVAQATRKPELLQLSERLLQRDQSNRRQAQEYTRRAGIPMRRVLKSGQVMEIQRVTPGRGPVFYITNNIDAADTVSTDEVWPGGSAGLNLDGSGMTVGEWDGGAIYAGHPDFAGRLTQVDGVSVVSNHSTHVAGTLAGSGDWLLPEARGMAYAAHLNAWDWNSDTAEMATAAAGGLLISNHSYGIAAGWLYLGEPVPDTWWWIGGELPSDIEDPNFGYYDTQSRLWDQIAYDAPYYLVVKAAGNDRTDIGPAPGEEYTVINQDGDFLFTSTLPRNADCAPAGFDCLPTNSVAKNVLTVGAVDDLPGGYSPLSGPSSVQMASFSGWGPTDDGRIKPDVVGNGMFLMSTWGDSPYYAAAAGTSMAAPNVTASLLLMQEHYQDLHGSGNFMRSATLKALAIHTADEAGDADGPDYAFGWGLLNTGNAAAVITEDGGDDQIIEGSLSNGGLDSVAINVTQADAIVKATLVWMDPPGVPVALTLDPPDLMLVNDLDLRISKGPTNYLPWVLDPASPASAASKGDNIRDNVEQVIVSGVGTGSYTVEVSHKNGLLSGLNQDYSLIISILPAPPTGSGLMIDEDFEGGLPAGWSVNTPSGISWTINTPVPGNSRLDNRTGGTGQFAIVDNGWVNQTITSLRTPLLDLSAKDAAVLRFKSFYVYDTFESLNVDASTDGGGSWFNVWQFQGLNPFPTNYVLDLSAAIAGQASVMLAFRFDSEGFLSGDFWQVDEVELEVFGGGPPPGDPPGTATGPNPSDGANGMGIDSILSWSAGSLATSHDVYFGSTNPPGLGELQGNQAGTSHDPGTLAYDSTYFWRIDEVNATATTTGTVWSFNTESEPPPPPEAMHLAGLDGIGVPARRGRWNAVVTINVVDSIGAPLAGVLVEGDWSNGSSGSTSCTSDAAGRCNVSKQNLKGNVPGVDFTLTNLIVTGYFYQSSDNEVPDAITVFKDDPNLQPNAVDDSFTTAVDTQVNSNVMTNDDPGDAPASVTASDATSAAGFTINMSANGDFSYLPFGGFEGNDSFGYTITDSDGDNASATVTISVGNPPANHTVTTTKSRNKGSQVVTVSWSNFTDVSVIISRNGVPQATIANSLGNWLDNLGKKPNGSFVYEVCEAGPGTACASDSVSY